MCIHCNPTVETGQKLQPNNVISCSLTIFSLNRTAMTAACKSNGGINNIFGATLLFQIRNVKSAEHLLVEIFDETLHTSRLKIRQETHEVAFCPSFY